LTSAGQPVRVGQACHGILKRLGGRHRQDFRFGRKGIGSFYSRTAGTLRARGLVTGRCGGCGHNYLVFGNLLSCHMIICLLTMGSFLSILAD
jgi:hypothetical protein